MRTRTIIVICFICLFSELVFAQSEQPGEEVPFPVAIPIDIIFSIDSSGSMGAPPEDVKPEDRVFYNRDPNNLRIQAAQNFVNSLNPDIHWVGVVSWNAPYQSHSGINFSSELSNNYGKVRDHLNQIVNGGGTDLGLGLKEALNLLERSPRPHAKKVVVFLTDGLGEFDPQLLNRAKKLQTTVYTIGLALPEEAPKEVQENMTAILEAMAFETGGIYFPTPTAENFQTIFKEIFQQVTGVFLDIETTSLMTSSSTDVTVRLNDISGVSAVTLEPVTVVFETTQGQLREQQVIIPKGKGTASTTLMMGDKAGLATVSASIQNLSTQKTVARVKPATADQPPSEHVDFKLIIDEPGVAAGRPMEIKVILVDDTDTPVQADKEYPLTFHFTPLDLKARQQSHSFRLPGENLFLQDAFAQAPSPSQSISNGDQVPWKKDHGSFSLKGILQKGKGVFTFQVTLLDAAVLRVRFESPGFSSQEQTIAAGKPGTPTKLIIVPNPDRIRADGKALTELTIILANEESVPVCTSNPYYQITLKSTLGGTIIPTNKIQIATGKCNTLSEDDTKLKASTRAGKAIITALSSSGLTADEEVRFLLIAPSLWQILFAALGGIMGGIIRRYRKLNKISTYQPRPNDFIGLFLPLELLAGVILYVLLYYGTSVLSLPFYRHFVFATLIGAAVGYSGSIIQDKISGQKQNLVILFTDLVGSTGLKKELGDQVAKNLEDVHKHLLMQSLGKFKDAKIVRVEGDSYIITFQEAQNAVHFALLAQMLHRQAREKDWPHLPEFRVGIHSGEVIVEEGVHGGIDIKGIEADTTARIMGLAKGSQILYSDKVFDADSKPLEGKKLKGIKSLRWHSHGNYTFKGRENEKIEIFEAGEEGIAPFVKPAGGEKAKPVN